MSLQQRDFQIFATELALGGPQGTTLQFVQGFAQTIGTLKTLDEASSLRRTQVAT